MNRAQINLSASLAEAEARQEADRKALDEVRALLAKADERRLREPQDARKWDRVLSNLEKSLDITKARLERSQVEYARLQAEVQALRGGRDSDFSEISALESASDEPDEAWDETMHRVEALSLEQAGELQSRIESGEIHDAELEAGLELANQRKSPEPLPRVEGTESRRQMVLRQAIDKIKKQRFDSMTLDEIKVVLACHSLLTSRLEPTSRDQRLRRIMDGAIKILLRKRAEMERR